MHIRDGIIHVPSVEACCFVAALLSPIFNGIPVCSKAGIGFQLPVSLIFEPGSFDQLF